MDMSEFNDFDLDHAADDLIVKRVESDDGLLFELLRLSLPVELQDRLSEVLLIAAVRCS